MITSKEEEKTDTALQEPVCLFQCGGIPLAIHLAFVDEILEVDRIVRLPLGPSEVFGLCTLRRDVIPVVALQASKPRGHEQTQVHSRRASSVLALIVRSDRGMWALNIDRSGTSVVEDTIESRPPTPHAEAAVVLSGSLTREGVDYGVIDPGATWHKIRERIESAYAKGSGRDHSSRSIESGSESSVLAPRTTAKSFEGSSLRGHS